MIDLSVLMLSVFYAMFGILLMIVSNIVIDFLSPGTFRRRFGAATARSRGSRQARSSASARSCARSSSRPSMTLCRSIS